MSKVALDIDTSNPSGFPETNINFVRAVADKQGLERNNLIPLCTLYNLKI